MSAGSCFWLRRVTILLIALLAFAYHHSTAAPASLASIGLLAFAAVAQFAPAIITGLYWRGATREGVFWGLLAGFAVWTYTLLLPNFVAGGVIGWPLFEQGPWGITWLRPQTLFGIELLSPVMRGAMLALATNVLVLVAISTLRGVSLRDRMAAMTFLRGTMPIAGVAPAGGARVGDLLAVTERILGAEAAERALDDYHTGLGRPVPRPAEPADRGLLQHMERVLAGAIGASSARLMFTHAMAGRGIAPEDVAELLDETSQELRFSRQLLQATMENVSQGIAVADAEACIVAWNRRYLEMFAYPEGLVCVGRPVAELIRWNASRGEFGDSDTERQIAKRIAHMKSGKAYVTQRLRRNGDVYEIRGQPLPDGGYVTTYNDITEFKRTELALLEAKQTLEQRVEERTSELKLALAAQEDAKRQAEEANATKSRFVAAASHDLLQPLNAARLFASTLGERSDDPAVTEIAERIDSSMRAAEEVLDDMLDIARLESGTMRTDIADFPIAETFEHLERQFAPLAARRGLRLRFTRPRCSVQSDRVLLRRIVQNLVSNALRYTQRGGVLVSCRRRGRSAEIQVWDTGPGIPQQHQRAIFDEFRRLDRPSPWGEHGLGLGLSICHRIALLLGHELGVRSQVGRGSVFSVSVPIGSATASAPAAVSQEPQPAAPASLVGLAVLLRRQRARDSLRHERIDDKVGSAGAHGRERIAGTQCTRAGSPGRHPRRLPAGERRDGRARTDAIDASRRRRAAAGCAGDRGPQRGGHGTSPGAGVPGAAQAREACGAARTARRARRTAGVRRPGRRASLAYSASSGGGRTRARSVASLPAASTACVRVATPSLRRIAVTCAFTVASDTSRSYAICLFSCPEQSAPSTRNCCGVRSAMRRATSRSSSPDGAPRGGWYPGGV